MTVAALVLGAGRGTRLRREVPKAFVPLAGRAILLRSLEALSACPAVNRIVPVVSAEAWPCLEALEPQLRAIRGIAPAVVGGAERQDSMRRGLEALPPGVTWVAVHDAARPLVRPGDVARVVEAARRHGAALLAVPLRDTVKRVREGCVVETPPRAECWGAQTPQVFRRELLTEALAKAEAEGIRGTDDASLVEHLGVRVQVVEGDATNLKITSPQDLELAETLLREVSS